MLIPRTVAAVEIRTVDGMPASLTSMDQPPAQHLVHGRDMDLLGARGRFGLAAAELIAPLQALYASWLLLGHWACESHGREKLNHDKGDFHGGEKR